MASVDFYPTSGDEFSGFEKNDANYFTARNASESDRTVGQVKAGQASGYDIYRGAICFDTSGLDDNCLIASATLTLTPANFLGAGVLMLKSGMPTYPHIPAVVGDYDRTLYSGNGGTGDAADAIINLNYVGLGWINKTGYTKFLLMSKNDVDGIAPTTNEFIVYGTSLASYKLTIVYTIPTNTPSVSNASYSGTKDIFTLASATPSDDGGGYEERGFEYGLSEVPTWAVRETGVWSGTSAFSLTISGLQPSTTYYARAFVTNSFGTSYSEEWTSFTTTASPAYGVYEEDNTATICFYISEDDGKTWGQKHGPYTTDQADIEITKLLVRGSGKKKIKFESDVLTGISASVMVKLDCKAR